MKLRTNAVYLGAAVAAALVSSTAMAQASGGTLEEVVVTSRKQAENLQEVPLAITAMTAQDMERRQVRDLADVATLTPGLNYEGYLGGNGTPVIRGAAQARITDLDQNVSTFFDGIYLPRQYLISPGVVGLERVEVVKGPQSALYGRNAFMGAINYVTKKPNDDLQGQVEVTAGGDERFDVVGELSGALIPGRLFGRVGYGMSEFDGDTKNYHPLANQVSRGSPGKLGGWDNESYQARLVFQATDTLEFDLGYYHFNLYVEQPPVVRWQSSVGDMNCGTIRANGLPGLYCGELSHRFSPLPGGGPDADTVVDPRGNGIDMTSNLMRGHVEWSPLSSLKVVYEYGHITAEAVGGASSDRDPILGTINPRAPDEPAGNYFSITPAGNMNYRSNELRLEWQATEALDLLLGIFDSRLTDFDTFPTGYLTLMDTAPWDLQSEDNVIAPGWNIGSRGTTDVNAQAVFGSASWHATDKLRVGLEARYAEEEKTLVSGPTTLSSAVRRMDGKWSQFTPRASVDYKLTDENMLYVTAAKGAKSGGFNLSALLPSQYEYMADENWTYELGSKNVLFDGSLRLNAAAFFVDWSNQQISCSALSLVPNLRPPSVVCNLGSAEILGFEADATWVPIDGLTVTAGFSYNDAKYGDEVVDQRMRDFGYCDGIVCPSDGSVGGNQLMRQSKVQGQLGAEYEFPIGSLDGFVGGDVGYKSKQYSDTMNLAYLPSRMLANMRAGIRADRYDVTLWVKNLTDESYASSAYAIFGATEVAYTPVGGPRLTWGVTARYKFGSNF